MFNFYPKTRVDVSQECKFTNRYFVLVEILSGFTKCTSVYDHREQEEQNGSSENTIGHSDCHVSFLKLLWVEHAAVRYEKS